MKYRDVQKESLLQTMKAEQLNKTLNTSLERLRKHFNIINHEGPPRRVDGIVQPPRNRAIRDFNFMTNMGWKDHGATPLLYDEEYNIEKIKALRSAPIVRAGTSHAKMRDFNMISNDYYEDPVNRKAREEEAQKEALARRYWDTHNYDPVKAQYYDAMKEEQYQVQRSLLSTVHGANKLAKLPPSESCSDGNSYNILNHSVYDDQRLKATRVMEDRSLNRIKRLAVETRLRQQGVVQYETAEEKRMNRISYKRWEEQLDRGYDFINNTVTEGEDRPTPLPTRPPSMWSRLNTAPAAAQGGPYPPPAADGAVRASTGNMMVDAARAQMEKELVPTGRTRNLAGGLPSGRDIVGGGAPLSLSISTSNNNHSQRHQGYGRGGGAKTAPQSLSGRMEKYESFLATATELPDIALNNQFSARNETRSARNPRPGVSSSSVDSIPRINNAHPSTTASTNNNGYIAPVSGRINELVPPPRSSTTAGGKSCGGGAIPSLDLTRTDFAERVSYHEPLSGGGPKGQAIPMVRTGGGLSSFRNN